MAGQFRVTLTKMNYAASMATDIDLSSGDKYPNSDRLVEKEQDIELEGTLFAASLLDSGDDDLEIEDPLNSSNVTVNVQIFDEACPRGPYPAECFLNAEDHLDKPDSILRVDFQIFDPDSWTRTNIEKAFERAPISRQKSVPMRFILTAPGGWDVEMHNLNFINEFDTVPIRSIMMWPSTELLGQ